MDASAGTTTSVFQRYKTVKAFGLNCRVSFRPELKVRRANENALVDEWFAAGQWTSYINYAGQAPCTPEFSFDQVRSRSWVAPSGGYTYSVIWNIPSASQMDVPVGDPFDFTISASVNPPDASLHVNPDFHVHPENLGVWTQDSAISAINVATPVSVPTSGLPGGVNRMVFVGTRGGVNSNTAFQTAVQVFPFRVRDGC